MADVSGRMRGELEEFGIHPLGGGMTVWALISDLRAWSYAARTWVSLERLDSDRPGRYHPAVPNGLG